MMPEPDYPAAHSMDTTWFAVDRDGHVAVFKSGEGGAVPVGACTDHEPIGGHNPLDALVAARPEAPYRLMDWVGEGHEEVHRELPDRSASGVLGTTLMFLDSRERVRAEDDQGLVDIEPAREGVAVLFYDLPVATAWRLHEAGACLGCFPWPEGESFFLLCDHIPRLIGVFRYDQDPEARFAIANPYVRGRSPEQPLTLDHLPPELREALGRMRFEGLCFAETGRLQPVAHVPCEAHGNAYLDVDGRTLRPMPGHEAEFRREGWEDVPEIRVEMPGPEPPGPSPGAGA